jgi:adenylylsulfate kinase-like enzyme
MGENKWIVITTTLLAANNAHLLSIVSTFRSDRQEIRQIIETG